MKQALLKFVLFVSLPSLVLAALTLIWLTVRSRHGANGVGGDRKKDRKRGMFRL